jgi:hypothetical protein
VDMAYKGKRISEAVNLSRENYIPNGGTALLDAIGYAINETRKDYASLTESQKPDNAIFVIITDGEENASKEFTQDQINKMISECKNEKWEFIFLGASQESIKAAKSYGISSANTACYNAQSIHANSAVYDTVSANLAMYRMTSDSDKLSFSAGQRTELSST